MTGPAFHGPVGIFNDPDKQINVSVTHPDGHDKNLGNFKNPQDGQKLRMPGGQAQEDDKGNAGEDAQKEYKRTQQSRSGDGSP